LCDMASAMIVEPERTAGPPHLISPRASSMTIPAAGGKIVAAPLTPIVPALAMQPAAPLQVRGSCRSGLHGYPCISRSQQIYPLIQPPCVSASTGAGNETCKHGVAGGATARTGTLSVPVRAVAVATESQETVGTARLMTRSILEDAAELAALKAVAARRDARMQQLEAELRRKDAAVKARDEQIAVLKRRCEELQRLARCASPSETECVQPRVETVKLADDGPDELRTPRPLQGLAREDTGVRKDKVIRETARSETCLPGYSRLLSPPSTSHSIAWSDVEEELVPMFCGSAAQGATADEIDAKVHQYFARFPDFKLQVQRLKPGSYYIGEPVCEAVTVRLTRGGKAVLKVCGKFRSLDKFLDEVRGVSRAASSLSPRSCLATARLREDSRRSCSACRVRASQRASSRA